jgi:hypothetical protein
MWQRPDLARPKEFNTIFNPAMAVPVFKTTIEVVKHLLPLEAAG